MRRLAVIASHPVQYQAPLWRALGSRFHLEVFFCHRQDARGQGRAGFGEDFDWDVPVLDGYCSRWLHNRAAVPGVDRFGGCDTPEVSDVLEAGNFDACLVNGWYLKSYLQAVRACRRYGIPVLIRGDSQLRAQRSRAIRLAKYLPYRWFLRLVDAHLYVGSANKEYLRYYGVPRDRLFFVPHFVDSRWFAARCAEARRGGEVRAQGSHFGIQAGEKVLLFVGKFIDKKRPADFVQAVAGLQRRGEPVCGLMVGSGPHGVALRELAAASGARIHFTGFQNQTRMPVCYALADVLVLPSDGRETWGLVVNEAMSCGIPAVVSDEVGSSRDLADDPRAGRTYPCGDVGALMDAVSALCATRTSHPAEVAAALQAKMARFSVERAVQGIVEAADWVAAGASRVSGRQ